MDLHYVSDAQGRHTAVIIPIEEWNNLTLQHQELKALENPTAEYSPKKPSDFVGCISQETAQKMIADIEYSRKQWERNI